MGIPWEAALALRKAGWYLRSEIIWLKKSSMPESCVDRPSRQHEQVFLLAKSAKYFFDLIGARELATGNAYSRGRGVNLKAKQGDSIIRASTKQNESFSAAVREINAYRNQRTVWALSSYPLKARHFAAFVPELVRRCLLSAPIDGGCCQSCGTAWARVFKKVRSPTRPGTKSKLGSNWATGKGPHHSVDHNRSDSDHAKNGRHENSPYREHSDIVGNRDPQRHVTEFETIGWWPRCKCYGVVPCRRSNQEDMRTPQFDPAFADQYTREPCVVLDLFHRAGTTWKVCERLGVKYIGIELSEKYIRESLDRPVLRFPHEKRVRDRRRKRRAIDHTPLFPEEEASDVGPYRTENSMRSRQGHAAEVVGDSRP